MVALSIEGGARNPMGLDEYLVVHGTARVTEGGAPELLQRLAERVPRSGREVPADGRPAAGFVTRITVDRVAGVGPWAGVSRRARAVALHARIRSPFGS